MNAQQAEDPAAPGPGLTWRRIIAAGPRTAKYLRKAGREYPVIRFSPR